MPWPLHGEASGFSRCVRRVSSCRNCLSLGLKVKTNLVRASSAWGAEEKTRERLLISSISKCSVNVSMAFGTWHITS